MSTKDKYSFNVEKEENHAVMLANLLTVQLFPHYKSCMHSVCEMNLSNNWTVSCSFEQKMKYFCATN